MLIRDPNKNDSLDVSILSDKPHHVDARNRCTTRSVHFSSVVASDYSYFGRLLIYSEKGSSVTSLAAADLQLSSLDRHLACLRRRQHHRQCPVYLCSLYPTFKAAHMAAAAS